MKRFDVAVIGGGFAGLIAANDLAEAGRRVVLLEKGERLGGRGATKEKNGAMFNLGGQTLYKLGELNAALQECGIRPEGGSPPASGFANGRTGRMRSRATRSSFSHRNYCLGRVKWRWDA